MTDDKWRPLHDMPDEINVLFIEGLCSVPWFQNRFWTCPPITGDRRPFSSMKSYRVWCFDGDEYELDASSDIEPDAYGMEECVKEIESGKYHGIVVVDFSNFMSVFDENLGPHLQQFVAAGGVVAFPSSESLLIPSFQQFFGVEWERSDYYRTNWMPCEENTENINYSFGNGDLARRIIKSYSAKGNTLKSVPRHERCFGVGQDSKTWSMVPQFNNRDVSRSGGDDSDDDYDVIVAMHEYGKGVIAYFGDINDETETLWLVASFIASRAPKLPIDCFSSLSDVEFSQVIQFKESGNIDFGASELDQAEVHYQSALEIYGLKLGSNGVQRDTFVALHSNMSLVFLKKKLYKAAEEAAGRGLSIQWGHSKCSYRRAMARLCISLATKGGDLNRIRGALQDVLNGAPGDATRELLERIEREKRRLEKRQRERFSSDFAYAMSDSLRN